MATNNLESVLDVVQQQNGSSSLVPSPRRSSRPKKSSNSGRGSADKGKGKGKGKDLKDPELYEALMKQCVLEESLMAEANNGGGGSSGIKRPGSSSGHQIYKAPAFVTQYLARNDVRPLKKVKREPFKVIITT